MHLQYQLWTIDKGAPEPLPEGGRGEVDLDQKRFVLTERTSPSKQATDWAQLLGHHASHAGLPQNTSLHDWLSPAHKIWRSRFRQKSRLWNQANLPQMGGACLAMMELSPTQNQFEWNALIQGDLGIFQIRDGNTLHLFPEGARPPGKPCFFSEPRPLNHTPYIGSGEGNAGDILVMVSAPLAKWINTRLAHGDDPWMQLLSFRDDDAFGRFITRERTRGRLIDTDISMLMVYTAPLIESSMDRSETEELEAQTAATAAALETTELPDLGFLDMLESEELEPDSDTLVSAAMVSEVIADEERADPSFAGLVGALFDDPDEDPLSEEIVLNPEDDLLRRPVGSPLLEAPEPPEMLLDLTNPSEALIAELALEAADGDGDDIAILALGEPEEDEDEADQPWNKKFDYEDFLRPVSDETIEVIEVGEAPDDLDLSEFDAEFQDLAFPSPPSNTDFTPYPNPDLLSSRSLVVMGVISLIASLLIANLLKVSGVFAFSTDMNLITHRMELLESQQASILAQQQVLQSQWESFLLQQQAALLTATVEADASTEATGQQGSVPAPEPATRPAPRQRRIPRTPTIHSSDVSSGWINCLPSTCELTGNTVRLQGVVAVWASPFSDGRVAIIGPGQFSFSGKQDVAGDKWVEVSNLK